MANTIKIEANEEIELVINAKSGVKITLNSQTGDSKMGKNYSEFIWDNGCFLSKEELEL